MHRSFQLNLLESGLSRSPLRILLLTLLVLGGLPLSPKAHATDPSNTFYGLDALIDATGTFETAIGVSALERATGDDNTAIGFDAMAFASSGDLNTATGLGALFRNSGQENTATGSRTLSSNTSGSHNTANGGEALSNNTTASENTAIGFAALFSNTTGSNNTANGFSALYNNTGTGNTAHGSQALFSNTTGGNNTAVGINALYSNVAGNFNTATGTQALQSAKSNFNAAFGFWALISDTTGANNVALGYQAGANLTTGGNNIDVGANVVGNAGEANTIRIGKSGTQQKTFIAGISGKTVASGVGVIINSSGQLGTVLSSARFKTAIKPMDQSSEALLKLKPVTFRYKEELDPEKIPQFGLIAEEVEKVNPDLVVRDEEGKVMSVRYEAVNAMLLNEFLKEHRKVEAQEQKTHEQEATIAQLKLMAAQQQKEIATLSATVQKVSEQLELNKRAPQLVANDQ